MGFIIWMLCIRHCAYQGSKRVVGTFNGIIYGALFTVIGVLIVRSSRRLDDETRITELVLQEKTIS